MNSHRLSIVKARHLRTGQEVPGHGRVLSIHHRRDADGRDRLRVYFSHHPNGARYFDADEHVAVHH